MAAPAQTATQLDLIREALEILIEPGATVELRALKTANGTISGYFNDLDALAKAALMVNARDTVYITPNPVNPDLLARSVNRVQPYVRTTTNDDDILRRRWLFSDFDPVRPTGISSTADEHAAAIARSFRARAFLMTLGFPYTSMVSADSGNGAHVLVRVDEPNDAATNNLFANCLEALKFQLGDDAIMADTTVSNAARIWKCYGTVARKGDSTPDRPHRLARILEVPSTLTVAPRALLEKLAGLLPVAEEVTRSSFSTGNTFDIKRWIKEHGIRVAREGQWRDGYRWVLEECPWNAEHTDNSAFIIERASGMLGAGCHHDHCQGKGWRDLRLVYEPRAYDEPIILRPEQANGHSSGLETESPASVKTQQQWPDQLSPEAYHGLAGDIVRTIEPHTESDPAAILLQMLTCFGNAIGKEPHFRVEADDHALKLFVILVGASSKARKGTSYGQARRLFRMAAREWTDSRVISGMSTGEGLIWAIRDPIVKTEAIKEHGQIVGYQEVVTDPGVEDKRLLAYEPEYGSVLRIMQRDGNSLSGIIRKAWDSDALATLTKNSPAKSTGAHVSIIGHVTDDELRRYLDRTDAANGYGNRHLWVAVKRSRLLPNGGSLQDSDLEPLAFRLRNAIEFAGSVGLIRRDETADLAWNQIYEKLSTGTSGMAGLLTARAEAQVMRLSCLYALLDESDVVTIDHLRAALAVWEYAEASVRWVFGDSLGDPDADAILQALKTSPDGLTREQISVDIFARNRSASQINRALNMLLARSLAHVEKAVTGERGRPAERWLSGPPR